MCMLRIMNLFSSVIIFRAFLLCKIPVLFKNNSFMDSLLYRELRLFHYMRFITCSCFLFGAPASVCYLPHIHRVINNLFEKIIIICFTFIALLKTNVFGKRQGKHMNFISSSLKLSQYIFR